MSILQRNKKLTVGLGIAAVVVAVAAIGAGTYAAFSDTETGPGGTATAGTLDLEVGGSGSGRAVQGRQHQARFQSDQHSFHCERRLIGRRPVRDCPTDQR